MTASFHFILSMLTILHHLFLLKMKAFFVVRATYPA